MDTKLTLTLDQEVVEKTKKYASDKKISLSRLIEFYLQSLTSENKEGDFEISPFVKVFLQEPAFTPIWNIRENTLITLSRNTNEKQPARRI